MAKSLITVVRVIFCPASPNQHRQMWLPNLIFACHLASGSTDTTSGIGSGFNLSACARARACYKHSRPFTVPSRSCRDFVKWGPHGCWGPPHNACSACGKGRPCVQPGYGFSSCRDLEFYNDTGLVLDTPAGQTFSSVNQKYL